jgi:hypothetical protein
MKTRHEAAFSTGHQARPPASLDVPQRMGFRELVPSPRARRPGGAAGLWRLNILQTAEPPDAVKENMVKPHG